MEKNILKQDYIDWFDIVGISKLRKTEERKRKEEQKKTSSGRFDVHSIMNRAFEMRRKAMEASDSEGGEEGDSDENEDEWDEDWRDSSLRLKCFI